MSDDILSQEELDALLNGLNIDNSSDDSLSENDKDLLGEVGNIAMGSASTALSTIIHNTVNITTPKVSITSLEEMKENFQVPVVSLEVEYIKGLEGINLLLMKLSDAGIIADLMMGGSGQNKNKLELTEMELSAVGEAMNQMIGSAATSLAKMLNTENNISPPVSKIWDDRSKNLSDKINKDEKIVRIAFDLKIDKFIDSEIMLLLLMDTAKMIIDKMMGNNTENLEFKKINEEKNTNVNVEPRININQNNNSDINVKKVQFAPLSQVSNSEKQNIDLILDVPLDVSVVLGRTKKTIKDILSLGTGSLVELDRLTEEPVEILVNGKKVALGEVVVIDENFGVRITNIVSNDERVRSLQDK